MIKKKLVDRQKCDLYIQLTWHDSIHNATKFTDTYM